MTSRTAAAKATSDSSGSAAPIEALNEVRLVGRLSAPPVIKHLPSGAEVVQLRVVVTRTAGARPKPAAGAPRSPTVDTIDVACWSVPTRRRGSACTGTEVVEVSGALRRRFWRGPHGVASRYEVEADTLRVRRGA